MDDLIAFAFAFASARLDEDEATARAAPGQHWGYRDSWVWAESFEVADVFGIPDTDETGTHIARHDPARALREVAAKRAILGRHKPLADASGHLCCAWCSDDADTASLNMRWPCPDVRALAAVYSDHPDYRPEWKP